ncbi:putative uncharacterized protein [Dorea sp. CAG:317]|nr:putative uncharacterized protein [Dorea sp. CAG:317]
MNKETLKRYVQLALVVSSAGVIYPIAYLKNNYQETLLSVFNISLQDLNTIFLFLGIISVVSYFPSGILCDKFSCKKLLVISLAGTAAAGFWFATVPEFAGIVMIYILWGIFSIFTFWAAHMKLIKLLARPEEQGRFFGILDGGRGLIEAILGVVAVTIFANRMGVDPGADEKRSAMVALVYLYTIAIVIVMVLVIIFMDDDKNPNGMFRKGSDVKSEKFKLSECKELMKNKTVFVMAAIVFMAYSLTWTLYYFSGFLESNIGIDAVTVGVVMTVVLWLRPVGGFVGGFIGDKFGRAKAIFIALLTSAILLIVVSILPVTSGNTLFIAIILVLSFFIYAVRGTYWSLMDDCKVNPAIIGTAMGFTALLGYLPDIVIPMFNSFMFNHFGPIAGYNAYFIGSAVLGFIGVVFIAIFMMLVKKNKEVN